MTSNIVPNHIFNKVYKVGLKPITAERCFRKLREDYRGGLSGSDKVVYGKEAILIDRKKNTWELRQNFIGFLFKRDPDGILLSVMDQQLIAIREGRIKWGEIYGRLEEE